MSRTKLNAVLLASLGAVAFFPGAAHATLITKASPIDVHFTATNSQSDSSVAPGVKTSVSNVTMNTTALNKFDKSVGVLTGVNVKLNSTYTQSTNVTVVGGGTGANTVGTFSASGSGSSSIKLLIPEGVSGGAASSGSVVDNCSTASNGHIKDSCDNGATPKTVNDNVTVNSADLNKYVGAGTFNAQHIAVSNTADLTSNEFKGTATATSTITWDGNLNAEYSYLEHAAQSFDANSFLNTLTLDFGTLYIGDTFDAKNFSIWNRAGDRVALNLTNILGSGDTGAFSSTLATFNGLGAGQSNGYAASFTGTAAGLYSATYQLTLADLGLASYASDSLNTNYALTLNLQAKLQQREVPPASDVPEPASLMLFGLGSLAAAFARRRKA